MRTFKTTSLLLASGLATLFMLQPALALDAQDFADRVIAVGKAAGYDITFGSVSADGDTVTVQGGTIGLVGPDEEKITFDDELTFIEVVENSDGSYDAYALLMPDLDMELSAENNTRVTLDDIAVEGLYLPPAGEISWLHLSQAVQRLASGALSLTVDGTQVFGIDSMEMTSAFTHDGDDLTEMATDTFLEGARVNLKTLTDMVPQMAAVSAVLGIDELKLDLSQKSRWTLADGRVLIDDSYLELADLGTISFNADFSGLTIAVVDKLAAMQEFDPEATLEEIEAMEMLVGMELMEALTITSAGIRYDDASLAPKLLDTFSLGRTRADLVKDVKELVAGAVDQLNAPALTALVVPAIGEFLDDPQNIEIAIKPATPTRLLTLSAAATNPAALVSALGLAVTANK